MKEKGRRGRRERREEEDFQLINSELNTLASSCVKSKEAEEEAEDEEEEEFSK